MNMKPREDGEGVAMNKTSKDLSYPNMTQDEPERVIPKPHWKVVRDLEDRLAVAEKRAEGAEAETLSLMMDAVELRNDLERSISERDSSQASLLRVVEWLRERADGWQAWREKFPEIPAHRFDAAHALREAAGLIEEGELIRTALSPHTEK